MPATRGLILRARRRCGGCAPPQQNVVAHAACSQALPLLPPAERVSSSSRRNDAERGRARRHAMPATMHDFRHMPQAEFRVKENRRRAATSPPPPTLMRRPRMRVYSGSKRSPCRPVLYREVQQQNRIAARRLVPRCLRAAVAIEHAPRASAALLATRVHAPRTNSRCRTSSRAFNREQRPVVLCRASPSAQQQQQPNARHSSCATPIYTALPRRYMRVLSKRARPSCSTGAEGQDGDASVRHARLRRGIYEQAPRPSDREMPPCLLPNSSRHALPFKPGTVHA